MAQGFVVRPLTPAFVSGINVLGTAKCRPCGRQILRTQNDPELGFLNGELAFPGHRRCQDHLFCKSKVRTVMAVGVAPVIEKKTFKQPVKEPSRVTSKGKPYRLYILNDPFNKREYVVKILLETVSGLGFSRAYAAMQEAHTNGRGLVIVTQQEMAEHYCSCINLKGIFSTIEPDD